MKSLKRNCRIICIDAALADTVIWYFGINIITNV